MKILALERSVSGVSASDFAPHLRAEAHHAWELYQAGAIRELYFRTDQPSAVLILECSGLDEARQVLGTLPLVQERLIDFELIPLRAYSGFGRLFEEKHSSAVQ
jgi:hypothetical protein